VICGIALTVVDHFEVFVQRKILTVVTFGGTKYMQTQKKIGEI